MKVIILDDDPTGTQTVSGVDVILHPSPEAFLEFFHGGELAVYVLTNSRSMPEHEAVSLLREICGQVRHAAQRANSRFAFILRGDSTLRGHVFAEIDVLASDDSVTLFVPAFPEGGRVTVGGIHYLETEAGRVPVANTEFAADKNFGYSSVRITDWVAEVGGGRAALTVPLELVRSEGSGAVASALLKAPAGMVVVPDAETYSDLNEIALGLAAAEEQGRSVVVRSASTFAAIRAGLTGRLIPPASPGSAGRTLIVCGSYTSAAGRQLKRILEERKLEPLIVRLNEIVKEERHGVYADAAAKQLIGELQRNSLAVLCTEREILPEDGSFETGNKLMSVIVSAVERVSPYCDMVIAKGGITSAQTATDGLKAATARVMGQLEPGVSLWELHLFNGRTMPYAVIPGNVGDDGTISRVAQSMGV